MPSQHSQPPRGLDATRSPLYQGRFGRMFPDALPGVYAADGSTKTSEANLRKLGDAMIAGLDAPKDGLDAEESGIWQADAAPAAVSSSITTSPSTRSAF